MCASLQGQGLASRRTRKPYEAPRVISSTPARVGLATLPGAALAHPERVRQALGSVPAAVLASWRELAAAGAPCRAGECTDPLCELARAILGWRP